MPGRQKWEKKVYRVPLELNYAEKLELVCDKLNVEPRALLRLTIKRMLDETDYEDVLSAAEEIRSSSAHKARENRLQRDSSGVSLKSSHPVRKGQI